jgi:hypothetical protein
MIVIDDPKRHAWSANCGSLGVIDAKGLRECWACGRPRDEHTFAVGEHGGVVEIATGIERAPE